MANPTSLPPSDDDVHSDDDIIREVKSRLKETPKFRLLILLNSPIFLVLCRLEVQALLQVMLALRPVEQRIRTLVFAMYVRTGCPKYPLKRWPLWPVNTSLGA